MPQTEHLLLSSVPAREYVQSAWFLGQLVLPIRRGKDIFAEARTGVIVSCRQHSTQNFKTLTLPGVKFSISQKQPGWDCGRDNIP